jgi:hypothetical protein
MQDPTISSSTVAGILADKEAAELDQVVRLALTDDAVLQQLLDGTVSTTEALRYNCFRALLALADDRPERLYPSWDYLLGLLGSKNSYHRSIAVNLLARLARADVEGRFEPIFDRFFALLDDDSLVTARYLAQNAGRIACAKPHLRTAITARLLDIDRTHHPAGRKDLIKADIVHSFAGYFAASPDQASIRAFVQGQLHSSSPKTRAAAKEFLRTFPA